MLSSPFHRQEYSPALEARRSVSLSDRLAGNGQRAMILDLLPLILAIPFGVLANLLTPQIDSAISRRSKSSALNRLNKRHEDLGFVMDLATNKAHLAYHYIALFLRAVLIVVIVSVVNAVLSLMIGFLTTIGLHPPINLWILTYIVDLVGAIIVIRLIISGLRDIEKIRNIEEYKSLFDDQRKE